MNAISWIGQFVQRQVALLRMRLAALYLYNDYKNDSELIAFTAIDGDGFYEYCEIQ